MSSNKLYVAQIVESTSTDGVGLRNALYVSGCNFHCPGCHNEKWWPLNSGQEMEIEEVFAALNVDDFNISILGGEPLMQYESILELCKLVKERTKKSIWLWTGYEIQQVQDLFGELMKYVDVIVDGAYQQSLRDTNLPFRGSRNQRIYEIHHHPKIDVCDITDRFV